METEEVISLVPEELHQDIDLVIDLFREALQKSGAGDPDEIKIIKPQMGSLGDGIVEQMFINFGVGSMGWLTMKWVDDYVWPLIKDKIDKPSKELLDRIKKLLPDNE